MLSSAQDVCGSMPRILFAGMITAPVMVGSNTKTPGAIPEDIRVLNVLQYLSVLYSRTQKGKLDLTKIQLQIHLQILQLQFSNSIQWPSRDSVSHRRSALLYREYYFKSNQPRFLTIYYSLFIAPVVAQAPTPCVTITTTTVPPCDTPQTCKPMGCPEIATQVTQPCGCPIPAVTKTVQKPCGCQGCQSHTFVVPATSCSGKPCAVVTTSEYPACPQVTGCVSPDCITISSIVLGCSCTGISTTTECNGKCRTGCATEYKGLPVPCPVSSIPS